MEALDDAENELTAGPAPLAASARVFELPPELAGEELPRALFGYDKDAVSRLLANLRNRFLELWQEVAEREERIWNLELELGRGRETQRAIGETLLFAQQHAQSIREDARRSAESLLKSARKQAEKQQQEIEQDARAKADELIQTAEEERRKLLDEAGQAKAFVEQTHEQLSDFLLAAVRWYEGARLSGEDERDPNFGLSAQNISERAHLDPPGLDRSPDARVAEHT